MTFSGIAKMRNKRESVGAASANPSIAKRGSRPLLFECLEHRLLLAPIVKPSYFAANLVNSSASAGSEVWVSWIIKKPLVQLLDVDQDGIEANELDDVQIQIFANLAAENVTVTPHLTGGGLLKPANCFVSVDGDLQGYSPIVIRPDAPRNADFSIVVYGDFPDGLQLRSDILIAKTFTQDRTYSYSNSVDAFLGWFRNFDRDWIERYADSLSRTVLSQNLRTRQLIESELALQALRNKDATQEFGLNNMEAVLRIAYNGNAILHQWIPNTPTIILVHGIWNCYADQIKSGQDFQRAVGKSANILTFFWGGDACGLDDKSKEALTAQTRSVDRILAQANDSGVSALDLIPGPPFYGSGVQRAITRLTTEGSRDIVRTSVDLHLLIKLLGRAYQDGGYDPSKMINVVSHSQGTLITTAALSFVPPDNPSSYDLNRVLFVGANLHRTATEPGQELIRVPPKLRSVTNLWSPHDTTVTLRPLTDEIGAGNSGFTSPLPGVEQCNAENIKIPDTIRLAIRHYGDVEFNEALGQAVIGWWTWLKEHQKKTGFLTRFIRNEQNFPCSKENVGIFHSAASAIDGLSLEEVFLARSETIFDIPADGFQFRRSVAEINEVYSSPSLSAVQIDSSSAYRGQLVAIEAVGVSDRDNDEVRMDIYWDRNSNSIPDPGEYIDSDYNPRGGFRAAIDTSDLPATDVAFLVQVVDERNYRSQIQSVSLKIIEPGAPPPVLPSSISANSKANYTIVPHFDGKISYEPAHYRVGDGRIDFWELTPETGRGFRFGTTGSTDTALGLYDKATGQLLAFDEDNGDGVNAEIRWDLETSKAYLLAVAAQRSSAGQYGLNVSGGAQTLSGNVTTASPLYQAGISQDIVVPSQPEYFRLVAPEQSSILTIHLGTSSGLDGWVRVENKVHHTIATSFGQRSGTDEILVVPVTENEEYFVTVMGLNGTTGDYSLSVDFDPDDLGLPRSISLLPSTYLDVVPLPNGSVTIRDQQIASANEFRYYLFSPRQGSAYTFETFGYLDTQIAVYSGGGELLASDDDSNGGQNARVSLDLAEQDYWIVVRADAAETGAFDLQVTGEFEPVATLVPRGLRSTFAASRISLGTGERHVHYGITAPNNATTLSINARVFSGSLDVAIAVSDSRGQTFATADTGISGDSEQLGSIPVWPGETYYITVHGTRQTSGLFDLVGDFDPDYSVNKGVEFPVNTSTLGDQNFPVISTNSSGFSVVAWSSHDSYEIRAQRFDSSGQPIGAEFRVNDKRLDAIALPAIATAADGSFVVAWTYEGDVFFRRFDGYAQPLSADVRANSSRAAGRVAVAISLTGEIALAWTGPEADGSDLDVYMRLFTLDGIAITEEMRVNTTFEEGQISPDLSWAPDGTLFIVWEGEIDGGGNILGRYFSNTGQPLGPEFVINSEAGNHGSPRVATGPDGKRAIVWTWNSQESQGREILGRILKNANVFASDQFLVNTVTEGDQTDPVVAIGSQGNYFVTWVTRAEGSADIAGCRFHLDGDDKEPEFLLNQTVEGDQSRPFVATNGVLFFTVWASQDQDGSGTAVMGQQLIVEEVKKPHLEITDNAGLTDDEMVDFGRVPFDREIVTKTVTITNSGNSLLSVTDVHLYGDQEGVYSLNHYGDFSVNPQSSRELKVSFDPRATGTHFAILRFNHNDVSDELVGKSDQNTSSVFLSASVADAPRLRFLISAESVGEHQGRAAAVATISRAGSDIREPLIVQVSSSDVSEATAPTQVIIPANQESVSFEIDAVDDQLLDGTQRVSFAVAAEGFVGAVASFEVVDHEPLSILLNASTINERDGVSATSAVVTRNTTDTADPLWVSLFISDPTEIRVPPKVLIPAGQSSATFSVDAVDDALLDGAQYVELIASAIGYVSANASLAVMDHETVSVVLKNRIVPESSGAGATTGVVVRSNVDTSNPLIVTLTSTDDDSVSLPSLITIPSGQGVSDEFVVDITDDEMLDGTRVVQVIASAPGYYSIADNIHITDVESLTLFVDRLVFSESAGTEAAIATVKRNNIDVDSDLIVTLSSSDISEAAVAASIVIPAGSQEVSFYISSVDDDLLDGTQHIVITANAIGYEAAVQSMDVTDAETLHIVISMESFAENGGAAAVFGTASRSNIDNASPLTVELQSSDATELQIPSQITIAPGASSMMFALNAVDDDLLDGDQIVTISASSEGYRSASKLVTVADYETLSVVLDSNTINEDAGPNVVSATVTRSNSDSGEALLVFLTSSDSSEAIVRASVTIPSGMASTTFLVSAVDDSESDGNQLVTLLAEAAGYVVGVATLTTIDNEDSEPPTLSFVGLPQANPGDATYDIGIQYRDKFGVDGLSINDSDIVVTGPNNYLGVARLVPGLVQPDDPSIRDAIYQVRAPGGSWDSGDDGTYSVWMREKEVSDYSGNFVGPQELGRFVVDLEESGFPTVGSVTGAPTPVRKGQPFTLTASNVEFGNFTLGTSVEFYRDIDGDGFGDFFTDYLLCRDFDGSDGWSCTLSSLFTELPKFPEGDHTFLAMAYGSDGNLHNNILGPPAHTTVTVLPQPKLMLVLNDDVISEHDGMSATSGRLTRELADNSLPLTVNLVNTGSQKIRAPLEVTIPAGATSVTFDVDAVDDAIADGTQVAILTASTSGFIESIDAVLVLDHELLALSFDKRDVSENAIAPAAVGTVTRANQNLESPLRVLLNSSAPGELAVPSDVLIPANFSSVTFPVYSIDDLVLDGLKTVGITATAFGFENSSATLFIHDDETSDTPQARVNRQDLTDAGQASYILSVAYLDDDVIDTGTIDDRDILVTDNRGYAKLAQPLDMIVESGGQRVVQRYSVSPNDGVWGCGNNGEYTVTMQFEQVQDITGKAVAAADLGEFSVHIVTDDSEIPTATMITSPTVIQGAASQQVAIFYSDDQLLDFSTADSFDVRVMGPNGFSEKAMFRGWGPYIDGRSRWARYEVNAPGGLWDENDDGTYTVVMEQNAISDCSGNAVEAVELGTFVSDIGSANYAVAGSLTITPATVALGQQIQLVADEIHSTNGVDAVIFGHDDNGNGVWDVGDDIWYGVDVDGQDGWSVDVESNLFLPGISTFFASVLTSDYNGPPISAAVNIVTTTSSFLTVSVETGFLREYDSSDESRILASVDGIGTVARSNESDINQPLTVVLSNSNTREIAVPETILIPAGELSASFAISVHDDSFLDGVQAAIVSVNAQDHVGSSTPVFVSDYEALVVQLGSMVIREDAGMNSAVGTVIRTNANISEPIIVRLKSIDESELTVPSIVVIPAGQMSADFPVNSVDDQLLDGTQRVTIVASADGYVDGSSDIQVEDWERLGIIMITEVILENIAPNTAHGLIVRENTNIGTSLTVRLTSSDSAQALVPADVTIPAGQKSTVFPIQISDDSILNGDREIEISATALGYPESHVAFTIVDEERRPTANDDNVTTQSESKIQISVLSNDLDPNKNGLHVSSISEATHGKVSINDDGTITYQPNNGFNGYDGFTYAVTNDAGGSDVGEVFVKVNVAPFGSADTYVVNEDTFLSVPPMSLFANDIDLDGDPLTASLASGATHGNVTIGLDGSFRYMPLPDYNGVDTFSYSIKDESISSLPVLVTVVVMPVNDAPRMSLGDLLVSPNPILERSEVHISGVFVDVDGPQEHTVVINWGDGAPASVLFLEPEAVSFGPVEHVYGDNLAGGRSTYPVAVTVADYSASGTATFVADVLERYRNPANALDVSNDGVITPFDVVQILSFLVRHGSREPIGSSPPYIDTTSPDNLITPQDVLAVLTHIVRNGSGEGESQQGTVHSVRDLRIGMPSSVAVGSRQDWNQPVTLHNRRIQAAVILSYLTAVEAGERRTIEVLARTRAHIHPEAERDAISDTAVLELMHSDDPFVDLLIEGRGRGSEE